jgi:hypothetical protein
MSSIDSRFWGIFEKAPLILIVVEFSGWRSGGFNPSAETLETSAPVDGLCGTFE